MLTQQDFYAAKLAYEMDAADVWSALQAGERLLLIDARAPEAYQQETIPGALSVPHRSMDEASTARLPKDAVLVSFCDGIGCNASTKGALKLASLGFNVRELQGGLDWWIRDGYATTARAGAAVSCNC